MTDPTKPLTIMQDQNFPECRALIARFNRIDPEHVKRQRSNRATAAWERWREKNGRTGPHPRYRKEAA